MMLYTGRLSVLSGAFYRFISNCSCMEVYSEGHPCRMPGPTSFCARFIGEH